MRWAEEEGVYPVCCCRKHGVGRGYIEFYREERVERRNRSNVAIIKQVVKCLECAKEGASTTWREAGEAVGEGRGESEDVVSEEEGEG